MPGKFLWITGWILCLTCCFPGTGETGQTSSGPGKRENLIQPTTQPEIINPGGKTLETRIQAPEGFVRTELEHGSFGEYLRKLPLKPHGSPVLLYNGTEKARKVHAAVIRMDAGTRDLQQCADAVIRLRAEYLYSRHDFQAIHFNFTSGDTAFFSDWMEGLRPVVEGSNVKWIPQAGRDQSYPSFRKYLDIVFSYAGTWSLEKELVPAKIKEMREGDVFIEGGFPGHAIMVVDMADKPGTSEKIFLLAQSYMPAQEIHILINPSDPGISPWYRADFEENLVTPEWEFKTHDLRRFKK